MKHPDFYCENFIEHHNHLPKYQPKDCKEQCHKCMDVIIDHHFNKKKPTLKAGDKIQWSFGEDEPERFRNKTFSANIAIVNEKEKTYGVYAEYGQDYISFDQATKA